MNNEFGKYIGNELAYVVRVLDSEDISNKKHAWTARLEQAFSQMIGADGYSIAHNSGTSTLHTCLAAAGVCAGDEVISPAQTVIMTSFAAMHHNAIPVYADIDPDTFNIDPKDIERKITDRTKAIIAVHMHGLPADMDPIMKIAKERNIAVIEDSAQCVLSSYKGQMVGTIGDISSFSFETKKHLSAGEGGMVFTKDEHLAEAVRKTGGLGYKTLSAGGGLSSLLPTEFQNPDFKRHDTLAWNYRMNELTAAVALAQVERAEFLVDRRMKVASYYLEALDDCDWMLPQKVADDVTNSYWTFTVRYEGEEKYGVSWREFYDIFKENGGHGFYGGLSVAYEEPVMKEKRFLNSYYPDCDVFSDDRFDFEARRCEVAESIQPKMMQFKTNYRNLEEAKRQASILRDVVKKIQG